MHIFYENGSYSNTIKWLSAFIRKISLPKEDKKNRCNVDQWLLSTPAMTTSEWKEANCLQRHLSTRVTAHGLHHRICATKGFHSPNKGCQCTLCGKLCKMYHIIDCTRRTLTLSYYADDTNFQWYTMIYNLYCAQCV
jgi:hypothetical protein